MSAIDSVDVVISIITFRRPQMLDFLLDTVMELIASDADSMNISILVVDNDPDETAKHVVTSKANVRYVVESSPGIAAARQRVLDEVEDGTLLVCLDDDVIPTGDWLAPLLGLWKSSAATMVVGFVHYVYPAATDAWVVEGGFMRRKRIPTGSVLEAAAAGNFMMDVKMIRQLGVRFDPSLGFSGGEDTLFSKQVVRAGGTIVWCQESVVLGHVPVERTTRKFCRKRARSHGSASVLVNLRLAKSPCARVYVRSQGVIGGVLRVLWGTIHGIHGHLTLSAGRTGNGVRIAGRGFGMLSAALGIRSDEYRR